MKFILLNLITIFFNLSINAQQTVTINAQQPQGSDDSRLLDYYQSQRYAEAADYLKQSYPEPITDMKVLAKLAYASQMAARLVDAEGYYQRIYDQDSTNTAVLFNLGGINLRRGNNLKAEVYYKKILQRDTTNFVVYEHLGKISFEKGEQANMITYLTKANKINPAEPDVASDLSNILVVFKQYQQAADVLNKAIAIDPENVELLMSLLVLDATQDKYSDTKNTCLTLIKLGNHSSYVLTKLGAAYYNLKQYECCVATLADIPDMEKGETSCYLAGLAYEELKDYRMAIENFAKAIEIGISPNIASYYGEIAGSNENLLKYKKAASAYQKALQFAESPTIYYLLANLYDSKLKDKRNAVIYYKKYVASRPDPKKQTYLAYAKSRIEQLKD